jgi:hypothetical protein
MPAMRLRVERSTSVVTGIPGRFGLVLNSEQAVIRGAGHPGKMAFSRRRKSRCDKASPAAAVMLHLRSCYVSKAAILTIPVRSVPVENRSPT